MMTYEQGCDEDEFVNPYRPGRAVLKVIPDLQLVAAQIAGIIEVIRRLETSVDRLEATVAMRTGQDAWAAAAQETDRRLEE